MSERPRPHLRLTIDADNLILAIRLYRWREESDDSPDLMGHLQAIEHPWMYHVLLDFRRFTGVIHDTHIAAISEQWMKLERGRDLQKRMAVISTDLALRALLLPGADAMAHRGIDFFDTFDEGLDWLKEREVLLRETA